MCFGSMDHSVTSTFKKSWISWRQSPMWREQSSNSWEKILICTSFMVLAGIQTIRTAAGLIDVPLVSMANASLTQPCGSSVHQLLDHWWPSIYFFIILAIRQRKGMAESDISAALKTRTLIQNRRNSKQEERPRFGRDVARQRGHTGLHWVPKCAG